MINLLPQDYAKSIRYGRQNTILIKWLTGLAIAIGVLIVIFAAGWVYINQQSKSYQKNIDITNQELKTQNLSQVQKDAKEITGDMNVINKVLSQEINFSELIQAIGNDMPPGTTLTALSLSNKVTGALDLSANARDTTAAAQIAANLGDPQNQLFSKVDVVNVNCTSAANQTYKCTASLRALFSKTAQTKFLSVPSGSKQ